MSVGPEGIRFTCADGLAGVVRREGLAIVTDDGVAWGPLFDRFDLVERISNVSKLLPADGQFGCELRADAVARLIGKPPHADKTIELHNMGAKELCYARVEVPGRFDFVQPGTKKSMGLLRAVNDGRDRHAATVYGITNNLFVNIMVAPGDVCASVKTSSDDELSSAWLAVYRASDREERGKFNIVKDGSDFFLFEEHSGTWHIRSAMESSNHMLYAMKTVGGGAFWTGLSEADRKYVGSDRGGKAVFNRSVNAMWIDDFREGLDSVMTIIPFKNGSLELGTGAFRPLRWDDYVTQTIGYDYVPADQVPEEQHAFVRGFFEQVLPLPEERELVLRMLGSALDGKLVNKRFLVLQDRRGGDNGKSMVVKAAEFAMGTFCMSNQQSFLSASSHVNPNGHEANTLGYKGKRLVALHQLATNRRCLLQRF